VHGGVPGGRIPQSEGPGPETRGFCHSHPLGRDLPARALGRAERRVGGVSQDLRLAQVAVLVAKKRDLLDTLRACLHAWEGRVNACPDFVPSHAGGRRP
jgi:hypothetical protein